MKTPLPQHEQWLRDTWLAEMWGYCREVSPGERARKLHEDRQSQKRAEEWAVEIHTDELDTHVA